MGDLLFKDIEIEKLKTLLEKIQNDKIRVDNTHRAEVQKKFRLTRQIDKYENESLIAQTLAKAKEKIGIDINSTMAKLWTSIQIIFQHEELVKRSKAVITGVKKDLENMHGEKNKIIKVLNSKTNEELEEFGIDDITNTVLEVRRVLTKKNLML